MYIFLSVPICSVSRDVLKEVWKHLIPFCVQHIHSLHPEILLHGANICPTCQVSDQAQKLPFHEHWVYKHYWFSHWAFCACGLWAFHHRDGWSWIIIQCSEEVFRGVCAGSDERNECWSSQQLSVNSVWWRELKETVSVRKKQRIQDLEEGGSHEQYLHIAKENC